MRTRSSCHACRRRHRKCSTQSGATRCNGCEELDTDCDFGLKFHFRPSQQIKAGEAVKKTPKSQQDTHKSPSATRSSFDITTGTPTSKEPPSSVAGTVDIPAYQWDEAPGPTWEDTTPLVGLRPSPKLPDVASTLGVSHADIATASDRSEWWSTSIVAPRPRDSPFHTGTALLATSLAPSPPRPIREFTRREATLFRIWIQRISLISDGVDESRHFGVVVPRLALEHPILFYGILAVTSRMEAILTGSKSDFECTYYHSRCIELLIEAFSQPAEFYDATLLTAVVITRLYEENGTQPDTLTYHLDGARNLLSNDVITRLATSGGLAEAACWIHLRQAIYISVIRRQRLNIPLDVYKTLTAIRRTDDTSYANWAVYNFAQVLLVFFQEQPKDSSERTWESVERDVDMWFAARPSSFEPYFFELANPELDKPFPTMWMTSMAPTIALQYYYASLVVVCLKDCNKIAADGAFEAAKSRRFKENSVTSYLCTLIGIALSNDHAPNAWYLPCHMLNLCGYFIRHSIEREHTVRYLKAVNEQIQWNTEPIVETLTQQWSELDSFEIGPR